MYLASFDLTDLIAVFASTTLSAITGVVVGTWRASKVYTNLGRDVEELLRETRLAHTRIDRTEGRLSTIELTSARSEAHFQATLEVIRDMRSDHKDFRTTLARMETRIAALPCPDPPDAN